MYFLVHGNEIVASVDASNANRALDYFAAVKQLETSSLVSMGYSVVDKRPE